MTISEAAKLLNVTPKTIYTRLNRANNPAFTALQDGVKVITPDGQAFLGITVKPSNTNEIEQLRLENAALREQVSSLIASNSALTSQLIKSNDKLTQLLDQQQQLQLQMQQNTRRKWLLPWSKRKENL